MSEARRGFIQYAQNTKQDRKFTLRNMFDKYVDRFVQHALEITSICPECGEAARKAVSVQRTEEGVFGEWVCQNCRHPSRMFVPIEQLVEDFNVTRGCFNDVFPTFEEWKIQLKMKMSKANIPCHEKPDKTIVGKFGAEYREMDLETQKRRYRLYLSTLGQEVAVNA
jgi:transcription elongation factor Elf1